MESNSILSFPKRERSDISEHENNEAYKDDGLTGRTFRKSSRNLSFSGLDMKYENDNNNEEEETINDYNVTSLQHQGPDYPKKKRRLAAKHQHGKELSLHKAFSKEELNGLTNRLLVHLRVMYLGSPVEADLVCFHR